MSEESPEKGRLSSHYSSLDIEQQRRISDHKKKSKRIFLGQSMAHHWRLCCRGRWQLKNGPKRNKGRNRNSPQSRKWKANKSYSRPHDKDEGSAFYDIWLFKQDFDLSDIVLQENEICDARWTNKQEIRSIIENGEFIHASECPYLDELFAFCKSWRSSNIINTPILTTTLLML